MQRIKLHKSLALSLLFTGMLASGPALAEKPAAAGDGHGGKHGQDDGHPGKNGDNKGHDDDSSFKGHTPGVSLSFDDRQRTQVRNYYADQIHSGHCPPGLAKKHNGCMPPGQAKKWTIGRQLPRDVIFYDLSPEILVYLGPPPPQHRFVRVASDILMIAIGTGMVVDAIQDLSGM